MMAYIRLGIGVLIILLLLSTFFLAKEVRTLSGERQQLLIAAQDSGSLARKYINLHGEEVSKNEVLTQDLSNAKALKQNKAFEMARETQGVKKSFRNLEEVSTTKIDTKIDVTVPLKDTTIKTAAAPSTIKVFNYSDKFNNKLNGIVDGDSVHVTAEIPTDLEGVIYWQRRHKFLFIRYGHKDLIKELKSTNPWVKIKNQETIKIQKYGR